MYLNTWLLAKLEPVISMSPEHISVISKFSQIKYGPIGFSNNGPIGSTDMYLIWANFGINLRNFGGFEIALLAIHF